MEDKLPTPEELGERLKKGEITEAEAIEIMSERARREATLRMIDQARLAGYNAICNVRYESADIAGNAATNDGRTKPLKMASCTVSGTAYVQA